MAKDPKTAAEPATAVEVAAAEDPASAPEAVAAEALAVEAPAAADTGAAAAASSTTASAPAVASPWKQVPPNGVPPPFYPHPPYGAEYYGGFPYKGLPPPPPPPHHMPRDGRQAPYWNVGGTDASRKPGTEVDGREGASSPSQIENSHRELVQHMGCTCKKTHCLKLYCQCFGAKIYCSSNCRCMTCHNVAAHETERKNAMRAIVQRNPNAFDVKFRKAPIDEETKVLTHKTGCKCRRSACMKKYCECYAGNVKCSPHCRCTNCKNTGGPVVPMFDPSGMGPPTAYYDPTRYQVQHPPPQHVMQAAILGKQRAAAAAAAAAKADPTAAAAQDLAALKHGSPDSKGDGAEEQGIDSLMMAAYAMTEFGQGSSPSKSKPKAASETETVDMQDRRAKRSKVEV